EHHVADESIVLLHAEQAQHIALRELHLPDGAQDEYVKASVPEPLEVIALLGRHDVAIMGVEERGISVQHALEHELPHLLLELLLGHEIKMRPQSLPRSARSAECTTLPRLRRGASSAKGGGLRISPLHRTCRACRNCRLPCATDCRAH